MGTPSKSVDNTQQGERAVTVRNSSCLENLGRLEKWADWNFMKVRQSEGKILHLREKPA